MGWDTNYQIANNNASTFRDIYPSGLGESTAQVVTGGGSVSAGNSAPVEAAASVGGQANPVVGGIVFLVLVFGLMFLAKRLGTDDDFRSLKPSVYNVVTIALAATAGMPVLKFLATKFPVPGVSTWVLAA